MSYLFKFFSLFHLTQIPLFSVCLASSFSIKLGEKVTCPGFAGLSLCGPVSVESVCTRLWGRAGAKQVRGQSFPGCVGNCHLGGRGKGRLEPEPRVSKGFCAQWLSPPYCARRVPRRWSRTLRVGCAPLVSMHPHPLHCTFAPEGGRAGGRHAGAAPGVGGHAGGTALAHCQSPRPCSSGPSVMATLLCPDVWVFLCVCVFLYVRSCVCVCIQFGT